MVARSPKYVSLDEKHVIMEVIGFMLNDFNYLV